MKDAKGYYKILGVKPDADDAVIKSSYRDNAKKWHPDHNTTEDALEKFQKLSVAYEILKEEKTRLMYDLLSEVYNNANFPDMFALKVYKNQKGAEDFSVRSISQKRVLGKLVSEDVKENKDICSFSEARVKVFQNSLFNWLLGWWGIKAFKENIKALISNYKDIGTNKEDNLKLLIHNAIAFEGEKKKKEALASAKQALDYANSHQQDLLNKYIYLLGTNTKEEAPQWNYKLLKQIQLIIPALIVLLIVFNIINAFVSKNSDNWLAQKKINYYREVKFHSGKETVDDVVVAKIVNIPPDTNDLSMLYYPIYNTDVMVGPNDDFDILARLERGHTVRMTGFSPDKVWARIMIDDGSMGFVKLSILRQGVKEPIPEGSKIYTGVKYD
ncbi:MAG: J domain-containing protein [Lactobacillus sp.]|jgi:curved DNA-binding protein CbpA|nr:J domain-containing protein [Lactobacillus sp.]